MHSTKSLISRLETDYPALTFSLSNEFRWAPQEQTITIDKDAPDTEALTLHELGHALLGHTGYSQDIELIQCERDAWEYAKAILASKYDVVIAEDTIQDNLDTYREWLHARSTCPACQATGMQIATKRYQCLACGHEWSVNEARTCGLKRYAARPTQK